MIATLRRRRLGRRARRGGFLRPSAPAHRVLDARRCSPHRRRGRLGGRATASRPWASPTTATCTASSTSTRSADNRASSRSSAPSSTWRTRRRDERLQLRGARMDDSGGEAEGGKKPYYHLTTLVENATRLQEPDPALLAGVHGGLLPQAQGRLGPAGRALRGAHRHHRLPGWSRAPGDDEPAATRQRASAPAACSTSSVVTTSSSSSRTTASPSSTRTNPQLVRLAKRLQAAAARHQRQPLRAPARRRGPRRAAVRADRVAHERPGPVPLHTATTTT